MLKSVQEASVQIVPARTFSQIIKNRWGAIFAIKEGGKTKYIETSRWKSFY
jgi:hypothetical protein